MMTLLLVSATVSVFHVLSPSVVNGQTAQRNQSQLLLPGNYEKVTCDFDYKTCCWTNVGGVDFPLTWKHDVMVMSLVTDGNKKGRLASPWLDPVSDTYRCRLAFRYELDRARNGTCQLNLIRETMSGQERVVRSLDSGTGSFFETVTDDVQCSGDERYRLLFEGWKPCKKDEIAVYDVEFTVTNQPAPQTSAASSPHTASGINIAVIVVIGVMLVINVMIERFAQR